MVIRYCFRLYSCQTRYNRKTSIFRIDRNLLMHIIMLLISTIKQIEKGILILICDIFLRIRQFGEVDLIGP